MSDVTVQALRSLPRLAAVTLCLTLTACGGSQAVLAPAGDGADAIALMSWILFTGAGAILLLVLALTAYAALARPERRNRLASNRFIIGWGIVFPVVTLSALLVYGFTLMGTSRQSAAQPSLRIEITGEQYWWRVRYLTAAGETELASANEIRLPAGAPVELILRTRDVIHSFWAPTLAGKLDMIPGQENRLTLQATQPGIYRGQCAEYCGTQHAQMAFYAIVQPAAEFDRWLTERRAPAGEPATEEARQGRELFIQAGCGACHTIRGTAAAGQIGPDLTHVGGRHSLGAGMYPNSAEMLAIWIRDNQHIKPGNQMPPFAALGNAQVTAIAAFLEGLK